MAGDDAVEELRRKIADLRGLRKARAEADLLHKLMLVDNLGAVELARDSLARIEDMTAKARRRNADIRPYGEVQATILRALARALNNGGIFSEAERHLYAAVELFRELDNGVELIRSYQMLHLIHRDRRQFAKALKALDLAFHIARQINIHQFDAELLGSRATVLMLLGRLDESATAFHQGIEFAREARNLFVEIILLGDYGQLMCHLERYGQAEVIMQQAIQLERQHRATGDINYKTLLWNQARLLRIRGKVRSAISLLNEGSAIVRQASFPNDEVFLQFHISRLLMLLGEYGEAVRRLNAALAASEANTYTAGTAAVRVLLGLVFETAGFAEASSEQLERGRKVIDSMDVKERGLRNTVLLPLAILTLLRKDCPNAARFIRSLREEKARCLANRDHLKYVETGLTLGRLLEQQGDTEAARSEYLHVLECSRAGQLYLPLCFALHHLACLSSAEKRHEDAISHARDALGVAQTCALPDMEMRLHELLAAQYECGGEPRKALEHYRNARELKERVLSPHILAALQEQDRQSNYDRLLREQTALRKQLAGARESNATLQRVLQTKGAYIHHLRDTLAALGEALCCGEHESETDYYRRLSELRGTIESAVEQQGWDEFEREVQEHDDEFLLHLVREYPKLTSTERKICALIRLNNTSKDLARLLNIAPRSVQAYRYRIRKKFGISPEVDLNSYILGMK